MKYNYEDYWEDSEKERKKYYENLYSKVKSFYKFQKDKKILDVAGGSGQLSNYFGLKNITLIDVSDSGLKIAKKRFHFKTIKCDLAKEPWPTRGEKYDFVLCNEFLEHIHHPKRILFEINKSLKKGGILYIGQPNMKPDGEHHVRRINYTYLKSILKEKGFKIKEGIIVPKIIISKFSEMSSTKPLIVNMKLFIGATIGMFIPNKLKYTIAKKFPNFLGGFYHIKAEKL
jgi:2-polyprenyl-3-methyl-5-hydroxy-6-metoxy-1,4-benzoquinol methylase